MNNTKTYNQIYLDRFDAQSLQNAKDIVVTYQTHSQCFDVKYQGKKNKKQLFQSVYTFVEKLISNQQFYTEIVQFLGRNQQILDKKSQKESQKQDLFKNLSFKKMPITSMNYYDSQKQNIVERKLPNKRGRRESKKISIFICQEENNCPIFGSQEFLSSQSIKTLRQIKLPSIKLTPQLVTDIFQSPSPFLMTLSLCLFLRYCIKRNIKPQWGQAVWILAIATVEAFKIYYDQELNGMFQCFEEILRVSKKDLTDLQRCFLQSIDYNVIVKNYDYQFVLTKFVEVGKETTQMNIE